ncbi:MAG TPA: hypothetical protein VJJ02_02575 [Candidatus Paceibacterota bacterium]
MPFENIQGLLLKYHSYLSRRDTDCKKIHEVVTRISGIPITKEDITIKKGELHITGNSIMQNELFFYKEKILEELHKLGITTITEIR